MRVRVELDSTDVEAMILAQLMEIFGDKFPDAGEVSIEVKSKANSKSEWEAAEFRAVYAYDDRG